ncbi:hypothetical protein M7I_2965 [Glarea lozoyensis 74030]|uniref:Uncharacterized protein n=1 Tax=Glarea lozoyensis (strain ATCC 74030 / MF5533) TaxID=1104152 RepID=H0EK74_GLAL7|nr:hypothetical protein M7I_2965 [Glarea lozoyensis 74030]
MAFIVGLIDVCHDRGLDRFSSYLTIQIRDSSINVRRTVSWL